MPCPVVMQAMHQSKLDISSVLQRVFNWTAVTFTTVLLTDEFYTSKEYILGVEVDSSTGSGMATRLGRR